MSENSNYDEVCHIASHQGPRYLDRQYSPGCSESKLIGSQVAEALGNRASNQKVAGSILGRAK